MAIIARPGDPPVPKNITGELLDTLQLTMSNNYNTETRELNLCDFHNNSGNITLFTPLYL